MRQMYLLYEVADLRGKFSSDILSRYPAEENSRPLTRMGQVIEAGGKIGIANKASGRGAGEIRHGNRGMAPVRPIDECEGDGVAQTCGDEGALGAVITGILLQQNGGRKTRDAFSAGTSEAVSVETAVGSSTGVPLMGVLVRHVRHAYPGIEGVHDDTARAEIGLDNVFEFAFEVHRIQGLTIRYGQ